MKLADMSGFTSKALVFLVLAFTMSACMMTTNRPITAVGPNFATSYEAAQLASREIHADDRRRISLELTKPGQRKYAAVVAAARDFLAGKMRHLNADDRATVLHAMQLLHGAFADSPDEEG